MKETEVNKIKQRMKWFDGLKKDIEGLPERQPKEENTRQINIAIKYKLK